MSPQKDQDYFCEGMAEEITRRALMGRGTGWSDQRCGDDRRCLMIRHFMTVIVRWTLHKAGRRLSCQTRWLPPAFELQMAIDDKEPFFSRRFGRHD